MTRSKLALWATLTTVSIIAADAAPTRPTVIPLGMYLGVLPSLEVRFAGRERTVLLDTGGGLTVVTPATAGAIGCRPWGRVTGFRMRGDRVDMRRCDHVALGIAGLTVRVPEAGVWDFGKALPRNAPPLAGSIALDAFIHRAVTLDLARRRLILETPASLAARLHRERAIAVPMRFEREVDGASWVPLIGIDTPQGRLWMEIDSGSDGEVIVNRPLAHALGLNPADDRLQSMSVSIGGILPLRAPARVANLVIDGDIGEPVLRRWVITLDPACRELWLAPAARGSAAFAVARQRMNEKLEAPCAPNRLTDPASW